MTHNPELTTCEFHWHHCAQDMWSFASLLTLIWSRITTT